MRSLDTSPLLVTTSHCGRLVIALAEGGTGAMMVRLWLGTSFKEERLITIGTCKACKKGFFQMCDKGVVNGVSKGGGCT